MKDRKNSSLLGHRLKFRWLFLFSLFAGPLALPLGGQSAIAANNIAQQQKVSVTGKVVDNLGEPIIWCQCCCARSDSRYYNRH